MNGLSGMGMEQQEMPMMEQGAMEQQEPQEQGGVTVEDVIKALMQGVSPEELVKSGVPVELVKQAIAMMQAQMQQGQGQASPQEQGLSAAGMQ